MKTGILVCGLNGAGKSTFGKALAERLQFHFIDNEDLYFPKTDKNYLFADPRTKEEVESLLWNELQQHDRFVFAAVTGNYGKNILPFFRFAIFIEVPKEVRIQRVRNRSYERFGKRMESGGDLYEKEERFFAFVSNREEHMVTDWLQCLDCPVIRIDGTKPIEENIAFVLREMEI